MEQEKEKKSKISFPENTSEIISRLVKKHKLEKPNETILDRIRRKEKIPSWEIVDIVREIKEGKISQNNLSSELKSRLSISGKKSEDLASDIEINFFLVEKKEKSDSKKDNTDDIENILKEDTYREPIE